MNIPITVNEKKLVFDVQSDESLMSVLHNETSNHIKCGCQKGFCGSCTVLLNNEPVAACKIPIGIVRNAQVITLDYFEKTETYSYITQGFSKAGIHLCGFCNAGKYFLAYKLPVWQFCLSSHSESCIRCCISDSRTETVCLWHCWLSRSNIRLPTSLGMEDISFSFQ